MRTLVRSAVVVAALALSFAAGSAAAVTARPVVTGDHAGVQVVPVNCKNPAECSVKFN